MTVSAIVSDKGNEVIGASPTSTLKDICDILAKHRIGAVLITEGDKLVGIVSERDIVRVVAKTGIDALTHPVKEFMTHKVVTCTREDTIATVMARMTDGRFRHVPVVDGDKLTGVISIGDVVKYRIAQAEREAEDMRNYITTS